MLLVLEATELEATESVSEPVTQMAVEQSSHFSTAITFEISVKAMYILFRIKKQKQTNFEMMLERC